MKKFLLAIWNFIFFLKVKTVDGFWSAFDFFYAKFHKAPTVISIEKTIKFIASHKYSVSRFGDGEIKLVSGKGISFQDATPFAVEKLREVLSSDADGHCVALADVFSDLSAYNSETSKHWKKHLTRYRKSWYKYTKKGKIYFNAFMSRPYMAFADKSGCAKTFESLKKIWENEDVLFVEGEKSRLGIGNDLFDNANSIERILGPATQAFSKYAELLECAQKHGKTKLILLALGPCATALAYDLHCLGYRAIDIGHVDIEYEWFLSGALKKQAVKNKYVNEAGAGAGVEELNDTKYLSQIVARIDG